MATLVTYSPSPSRYEAMQYQRCGKSGLLLPRIALGLWHNFGAVDAESTATEIVLGAFERGVTHFDLANNYGPPPGSAEETFGRILGRELGAHRDELIISTKAGYGMWPGPYGDFGSRKYLLASLDQSLKRLGIPYVDIFYHHRPDPETPLEETMEALASAVRAGKALYVGLSNYTAAQTREAAALLRELHTPCLIHQPSYNMLNRWVEPELLETLSTEGIGCIAFSPLAQGVLTNRYLHSIPSDSRAARPSSPFLNPEDLSDKKLAMVLSLDAIAKLRGQSLAQMALAWVLRRPEVTSVLVGASRLSQLEDSLGALSGLGFDEAELAHIDTLVRAG
jgi:L-glyceraldehyde 3-phosphate reductase